MTSEAEELGPTILLSGRGISHGEGSFPRPPQHCILLHFYILPYHMGQKWCFFGLNCVS